MGKKPWLAAIAIFPGILFFLAQAWAGDLRLPGNQPVEITTMDFPKFGFEVRNAVDLAVAEFGGKLLGHPILTTHLGHGCNWTNENNNLTEGMIHDPKVLGLIGPICSGVAARIMPRLNDAAIPVISPANTGPFLTDPAFHLPFYYRTAPNDIFQADTGATFARQELGAATAAILYYDGGPEDYSMTLRQNFKDAFTQDGGSISGEFAVNFGQEDFSQILDALGSVDMVYAPIFSPDSIFFSKALRERDPEGKIAFLGGDGTMDGGLFEALGPDPLRMYFTNAIENGPNQESFVTAYLERYGHEPAPFEALAFDATSLLLRAAAAVGHVDANGNLTLAQSDLLQFMNDPGNYPVSGAGATYQAPQNGDLNPHGHGVFQAEGGDFVPIFP